jgi:hypothetical protein
MFASFNFPQSLTAGRPDAQRSQNRTEEKPNGSHSHIKVYHEAAWRTASQRANLNILRVGPL